MRNFLRSLRYLKPHRLRLASAIGCTVLIAALWGGGLAALVPAMNILLSEEGFHGWVYNGAIRARTGARMNWLPMPPGSVIRDGETDRPVELVLSVGGVERRSPAAGRLKPGEWLIGLEAADPAESSLRGNDLARLLAEARAPGPLRLRVYDPHTRRVAAVELVPEPLRWYRAVLVRAADAIPEPQTRPQRFGILLWVLGFGVAVTVARNVLRFVQDYLVGTAVWRGMVDLRRDSYDTVLRLPTTFFSERGATDAMSRFIQDTNDLAQGQQVFFSEAMVEPAKAAAALVMALGISWRLTLLALIAGPPVFILIRKFGKTMRRASRRALQSWSAMLGVLEETLTGIRVVKTYTMEGAERGRFVAVNRELFAQQRRMERILAAVAPAVETVGVTAAMGAIAIAGYWVFSGTMTSESFLALMGCLAALFDPMRRVAKVPPRITRAEAAAARVFELQDQPQEKRLRGAPAIPRLRQSVVFRDVTFSYPASPQPVLCGINLTVAAGQAVAIVGPSGCGKTTLISLLPRLLDPDEGAVLFDGHDIRQVSLRSLRQQIALVTQEPVIFNASVADNIAYGRRSARREAVLAAARQAYVDEFAADMPRGYETVIGEHGATLSGGQRQRIAIARAILRDPAIVIFDEALSQVDPESERKIHQALGEFRKGRTSFTVAHRFTTVLEADRIVVMEAGRVVDAGTHEELLTRSGLYRTLYQTQFGAVRP